MSHSEETDSELDGDFKWGKVKGVGSKNKDVIFYESCTYDGMDYFLYDSVYLYVEDKPEPYIGKLVKMWEQSNNRKRIKVVWFFRPTEIGDYLCNSPHDKEIFLASGTGKGVFNINPLGVLIGKCNVVCTSKDLRNPQPSEKEVQMADHIFYCLFDVDQLLITDKLEDEIGETEIRNFLNKKRVQKHSAVTKFGQNGNGKHKTSTQFYNLDSGEAVQSVTKISKLSLSGTGLKKATAKVIEEKQFPVEKDILRPQNALHNGVPKGDKIITTRPEKKSQLKSLESLYHFGALKGNSSGYHVRTCNDEDKVRPAKYFCVQDRGRKVLHGEDTIKLYNGSDASLTQVNKANDKVVKSTRRPDVDRSNWFKDLTWEEKLQAAYLGETVVRFENLDPSYSSEEVEELIYQIFKENCTAKVIPQVAFSSPHNGQALVIFKSKEVAEMVVNKLETKCLMLENGRPLLACKGSEIVPVHTTKFVGHLTIDYLHFHKQRHEMKNAVSTSHFPQPNTLEYDMAVEWGLIQRRSDLWWESLYKLQTKQLDPLKNRLKESKVDLVPSA